ncbi:MAG: metallophosphoesterase [Patescibacteria group bacterium]
MEPFSLQIVRRDLSYSDLPLNLEGLKIMHLSDFHCRSFTIREKRLVEVITREKPDFIFFTGDFVEKDEWISSCEEILSRIANENPNFFGVFGNHDHGLNTSTEKLESIFEKKGIKILTNESTVIKFKNGRFYLIGIDDPYLDYDNLSSALEDVEKNKFKILLSHSPQIFLEEKELINNNDIDLILSGHTHGGQINIPFITDFFLSLWPSGKYTAGLFEEGKVLIYVNRGIGSFYRLPLRLNAPPEATIITLRLK